MDNNEIVPWRAYQLRGRDKIINSLTSALFFRMGLGKTRSVLGAVQELMWNYFTVRKVIVVAPKRVAHIAWPQQIEEWLPEARYSVVYADKENDLSKYAEIYIVSFSTLPWLYRKMISDPGSIPKFDMVVIDESTKIKNPGTKTLELCKEMFGSIPRRVLLSGKPAPNGLLDLWAQIYFLDQGQRLFRTFEAFRTCKFIATGEGIHKRYEPMTGTREWIAGQLADLVETVTTDDSVQLPELIENFVVCELSDWNQKTYDKLERDQLISIGDTDIVCNNPAASLMKLRQFTQGFLYDAGVTTGFSDITKLEALKEIIEGSDSANIICAVQFKEDIRRIQRWYPKTPAIYSETSDKDTLKHIQDWNAGKIPLLLVHPSSVSHGLNIQAGGNVIVWYGLPWNLDEYEQLIARLHRSGQMLNVTVHHICIRNTVDEIIMACLKKKARTQNTLLDELVGYMDKKLGG